MLHSKTYYRPKQSLQRVTVSTKKNYQSLLISETFSSSHLIPPLCLLANRQVALLCVLHLEVFISELGSIDGLLSCDWAGWGGVVLWRLWDSKNQLGRATWKHLETTENHHQNHQWSCSSSRSARAVASGEIASLAHEARDNPMEDTAEEVQPPSSSGGGLVGGRLRWSSRVSA